MTTNLSAVFLLLCWIALASTDVVCAQETASALEERTVTLTAAEEVWLAENRTVRVSFWLHPPIFHMKDGKVVGIAVDFLDKIAEVTGISFQYENELERFSDVLNGLREHEGPDLVAALMPTTEREKDILFTAPYFSSPRFIFTRDDAPFVSSMEALFDQNIAVVRDYVVHSTLAERYPTIDLLICDDNEEALRAVSMGEAFAFIGDMVATPAMINEFGLHNLKAACPSGLPDHPLSMAIRDDWPELRDIVQKALEAIPAAEKLAIMNRWSTVRFEHGISAADVLKWVGGPLGIALLALLAFVVWNRQLRREVHRRIAEVIESQEQFRELIEQSPLAIEIHSVDGKFLASNPAYSRITGLYGAELEAVHERYDLRHDSQHRSIGHGPLLDRLYAGEEVAFPDFEYSVGEEADSLGIKVPDTGSLWARSIGFPLKDHAGRTKAVVVMTEDITEQKQAEENLEDLRAFTDRLIEQSPISIQVHDLDGRLRQWNAAYAKLYALNDQTLATLREKYDVRADVQAEALGLKPFIERVYQGENVAFPPYEYDGVDTLKTLDSKNPVSRRCWVQTRGFPLRDKKGNVTSAVFFSDDITERKRAEEKLEDLRTYTDQLIEAASVMIVSLDARGRVIHFNPAAETITGYTLAEVEGENWFELLVPRDRYPEVHEEFERLVKGGLPQVFENPIVTKAGEERHVSWRNSEVTKGEAIIGVTSFGMDITERKKIREAFTESEEKFRQMLAQSPLSIQILNRDGYLEDVNQAWMELWGVKEEELEALKASWCILEDEQITARGLMSLVERAFRGERVVLPDLEFDAAPVYDDAGLPIDGARKRWVRAHLYPVRKTSGEIINVVDVEEDITETKHAELKLQDYQERLRALAHELTVSEEHERRRIASELHDNAAQSLALARLRLAAAAKRVTDTRAVGELDDVTQLLRDSLQQIRDLVLDLSSPALTEIGLGAAIAEWSESQLRSRHGLQVSFSSACDHLKIDETVAAVLFRNTRELLSNVVKHAGAGRVAIRLACVDDELHVTVTDDGRGFSFADVEQRPTAEGGFGLFSIRERMSDLGGSLDVESAPGRGCTAILIMPQDRLTRKD